MKLRTLSTNWTAAAVLGAAALISPLAQADTSRNGITFELDLDDVRADRTPAAEKRLPAFKRIQSGFIPYFREGRGLERHDELSSRVMSLHFLCSRKMKLRAGHALAPNVHRIVRR